MRDKLEKNSKKLAKHILRKYRYFQITNAFKKRYQSVDNSLFEKNLDARILDKYIKRWDHFDIDIETDTFLLCYNLSGKIDFDIIPENLFAYIIEPRLNPYKNRQLSFLSTKNIYEKWFNFDNENIFPKSYFHKIDGVFYDRNFSIIKDIKTFLTEQHFTYPLICKPSIDTVGGYGIVVVTNIEQLISNINNSNNLVFQEMITQHETLNSINPGINSIRTCLYRNSSGSFEVLNNSIRFGVNGSLDNLTAGGIVCFIKSDGTLNNYAVSKYCKKHTTHPNTAVVFSDIKIPFIKELNKTAIAIANQIPLCNLVSLDMCLDSNSKWRCLEINLNNQTIRFSQYAGEGFFNKYTEQVIEKVS